MMPKTFARSTIVVCLICCLGCSEQPKDDAADQGARTEIEDGGHVENADRHKAEEFLVALKKVNSAEEEEKLLTEFGEWLRKNDYRINVAENNGKHQLSCPHFPPVTPWADYTFIDISNLELLPQHTP